MATGDEESAKLVLGAYEIKLTDKLGQGTFGVVYRGHHMKRSKEVAVKQCEIRDDEYGFMAMKEIKNFQQLENHPNIVRLLDFHYTRKSFWMIMEFCDAGDLIKYVKTSNPDLDSKINIMYQCASAIAFMHSREHPVVHRDIKPANIMMKTENGKAVVKVTDFGLSKVVEDAPDPGMTMMFTTAAGTPGFMAPEFFLQEKYTYSVDIFALGLVFLALLNYKQGDKELIPLSANNLKMRMIMPVGAEMAQYSKMNMPQPELVEDESTDSDRVKSLKALIRGMAAYERRNRTAMPTVESELQRLGGTCIGASAPPAVKKAEDRNADLEKKQRRYQSSESRSSDVGDEDSSTGTGDVGFMLLKEALEHAVRDKMKATAEKAAAEKQMKDIPFTSLLAHVLGEEKDIDRFEVDDRVRVIKDIDMVKELQKGHGEWNDGMRAYLGKEGVVKEKVLHVVKVRFDDEQVWSFNPRVLKDPKEADKTLDSDDVKRLSLSSSSPLTQERERASSSMFKRYDVVKIPDDEELVMCLQKNHGGWNPKMKHSLGVKGIVNRIDKDGDVFVECINGDDWTLNPEMLTHVDMTDEKVEAGDFVIVRDDKDMVKQLQEDHGGWVDTMATGLGKSGIVQTVGNGKAKVETRGRSFIWNAGALVVVAKGEEMLRAVLKKKVLV